jgi:hypothetical protein
MFALKSQFPNPVLGSTENNEPFGNLKWVLAGNKFQHLFHPLKKIESKKKTL